MFVLFILVLFIGKTARGRALFRRIRGLCSRGSDKRHQKRANNAASIVRLRKLSEADTAKVSVTTPLPPQHKDDAVSLKCPICQISPTVVVLTIPCGHLFCSDCIRHTIVANGGTDDYGYTQLNADSTIPCPLCAEFITGTIVPPLLQRNQRVAMPLPPDVHVDDINESNTMRTLLIRLLGWIVFFFCLPVYAVRRTCRFIVYTIRSLCTFTCTIAYLGCKVAVLMLIAACIVTLATRFLWPESIVLNGDVRNAEVHRLEPFRSSLVRIIRANAHVLLPLSISAPQPSLRCLDTDRPMYALSGGMDLGEQRQRRKLKKTTKECSAHAQVS